MSDMKAFRVYPRGFLGGKLPIQVERTPTAFAEERKQKQFQLNDHSTARTSIAANSAVEELYSQKLKLDPTSFRSDWNEKVFRAAFAAFGTKSFRTWYNAQHQSPAAGASHNDFLTDTLRFLTTGRRNTSLETWQALLTMSDEGNNIGDISGYAKTYFSNKNEVFTIEKTVLKWIQQPNGIVDLLGTLHILFGNP